MSRQPPRSTFETYLGSEEDDAALRYCRSYQYWTKQLAGLLQRTGDGQISQKLICIGRIHQVIDDVDSWVLSANDRCCILPSVLIQCSRGLQWLRKAVVYAIDFVLDRIRVAGISLGNMAKIAFPRRTTVRLAQYNIREHYPSVLFSLSLL